MPTRAIRVDYVDPEAAGPQSGDLTFRQGSALVRLADGRLVTLPYAQAQVGHSSGHPHPILTFVTGGQSYVRLYIQDADYGTKLPPDMPDGLRAGLQGAARTTRRRRYALPVAAAVLAGLMALGVGGTIWAVDRAVDAVPPEWEIKLGRQAVTAMVAGKECRDPAVVGAVQEIADRLIAVLPKSQPYPFHVQVVWDEVENAFALPGGEIVVHSGLIAAAASPDEVAGVLGHEIQHVLGRHSFRRMANDVGLNLVLAVLVGDSSMLTELGKGGVSLLGLKFDRNQESESDRIGMRLAYDAGYRPDGLADFFRRQMAQRKMGESTGKLLAYLSTHPADADRLDQITRLAAELPPVKPADAQAKARWASVRERAKRLPSRPRPPKGAGGPTGAGDSPERP